MQSKRIYFVAKSPEPGDCCTICGKSLEGMSTRPHVYGDGTPGIFCHTCALDIKCGFIVDPARG